MAPHDCEGHTYLAKAMAEIKADHEKLTDKQDYLRSTIIKLSENLLEIQRTERKLDEIIKEQNRRLDEHSKFIYKAIGVVGSVSFIALLSPIVMWIIDKAIQGGGVVK